MLERIFIERKLKIDECEEKNTGLPAQSVQRKEDRMNEKTAPAT